MCKNYVECPICGKKLMNMTSHIKAHGIEIKDFKIKYPNVDLVSESYRNKMSSKMKVVRNRDDVKAKTSENSKRMWSFLVSLKIKCIKFVLKCSQIKIYKRESLKH